MTPHCVLLACGSDWQAPVRLPRLFQRAGCKVTVFASPDWGITKTCFIDEIVPAPTDLPAYVDALREHLALNQRKYSWIVVVDDPLLEALVRKKEEAWAREILPLSRTSGFVDLLADKSALSHLSTKLDLSMPSSAVCDSPEEADAAAREIGYPLVVKLSSSYAGMGVRKVDDASQLHAMWTELRAEKQVVLQRFVDGRLGNTAALFSKGRLLASMSAFKSRTWPGAFGPSSARQFTDDDQIDVLLERFGRQTTYDGFCAFDWILNSADQINVIELNARPVPALHLAMRVGVDFSEAIRDFLTARSTPERLRAVPQCSSQTRNEAIFPMFPEDFQRAIAEADDAGLARFLPGEIGYDDIPWDDAPFLAHVLRRRATRRAFERLFPD
ncbi:MAG: ATP-grasp domain-containing protein [Polyangiaceae bacterium]